MSATQEALELLAQRQDLPPPVAGAVFEQIMDGAVAEPVIGALLMGLRAKGETVDELEAAVRAVRARMLAVAAPPGAVDTCGTGGDGLHTRNVSTAVAIVVAACGVPVAKHGNRSVSSRSGSTDVLAALGVDVDAPLERVSAGLAQLGIAYLAAPRHHAAMRHVAGVRKALGIRTMFNVLGPLANPANVRHQLIGVARADLAPLLAGTLARLGTERAWVVHGAGGMDELSTGGLNQVIAVDGTHMHSFTLDPADWHLPAATPADLRGGDPADNAAAIVALLAGEPGAYRDTVLFNAAATLTVAGAAADITAGLTAAADAIDTGAAADLLTRWAAMSRGEPTP